MSWRSLQNSPLESSCVVVTLIENYSTSKPLNVFPEKSQILSCDTVVSLLLCHCCRKWATRKWAIFGTNLQVMPFSSERRLLLGNVKGIFPVFSILSSYFEWIHHRSRNAVCSDRYCVFGISKEISPVLSILSSYVDKIQNRKSPRNWVTCRLNENGII